ncbi:MAG: FHA domain-containing protein [Sedimentisphaerales bacterium]|nr:FHA domain-containing protein [Sedimentisphaerales bacterium]
MAKTMLIVSGPTGTSQLPLDPVGVTVGRSATCDVILDHANVSRHHARISQDPFGRWIVEDLESHNGIMVEGQRVKAQAIVPDQKVSIHPFTLHLQEEDDRQTTSGTMIRTALPVVDKGLEEDIVPYRASEAASLSPDLMRHLNEFTNHLLKVARPSDLYYRACLSLAEMLDTLVAIVRLACHPDTDRGGAYSPEILACSLGAGTAGDEALQGYTLHLSKRVLDAVRKTDVPVMAGSGLYSDQSMVLTIVDTHRPHVVFAARVNDLGETVDALYVDILQDKSSKEMFDFIEAVARQINFTQKNLFFAELEKQEQALRQANSKLKEKDRIKDEYVARVTHDIKGHLAAIKSCLFIASDKSTGPLNDRQGEFLGRAENRTEQLTAFVKELLHLTQMRLSGQVKMAPFSLGDVISAALEAVASRAKEKTITVTSNVSPSLGQIVGDQFSIKEMVTNLLFNAVKYTPQGKTVHLEAADSGSDIRIDFVDTGIGIPADEIAYVFEEFFRASNAKASEKDGTGLGLSIVKQIVDRHGGHISAQSQEGQGTTFTVILPKNNSVLR